MAPKRKPPPQPAGPQKKGRPEAGEEDSFRSTAEALRTAPTEKRVIRVDPSCPLRHNPGTQGTPAALTPSRRCTRTTIAP